MFAYCNNNPVCRLDPGGDSSTNNLIEKTDAMGLMVTALAASAVVAAPTLAKEIVECTAQVLNSALTEVYEFCLSLRDSAAGFFENHQPRVHHIVPKGSYSNRRTRSKVAAMQAILIDVGIDPKTDPLNLVIISQGYHAGLHTDTYFENLYNCLAPAQGDREAVEWVLFCARVVIAFGDPYSKGY